MSRVFKVLYNLLLVIGPQATGSDYVTPEWWWAIEMGKCVNPIIRLDGWTGAERVDGYQMIPDEHQHTIPPF